MNVGMPTLGGVSLPRLRLKIAGTRVPCSSPAPPDPFSPVVVAPIVVPVVVVRVAVVDGAVDAVLAVAGALTCVIGPGTFVVNVPGISSLPPHAAAPRAAPAPASPARAAAIHGLARKAYADGPSPTENSASRSWREKTSNATMVCVRVTPLSW